MVSPLVMEHVPGDLSEAELEVINWRIEQLDGLGFGAEQAVVLALRRETDLGQARRMIRKGCTPELAFAILS